MDVRVKRYSQLSPERAEFWTEKIPKYRYNHHYHSPPPPPPPPQQHSRKVPVVYYLCRNRQLEHPHFMEVLISCDDLYLRDVIERLNVLRGRCIGSMYSWSCKRSYKNGFVWHDLCDDDVIHPAHGNEYILKGSELFEESDPGRFSPAPNFIVQGQRALPEPPIPRNQEESSFSCSFNGGTAKSWRDDELSPRLQHECASQELEVGKNPSWSGSLSPTGYKSEAKAIADASTQTQEKPRGVVERGVSTDDTLAESHQNLESPPPPSATNDASLTGRTNTLESLIRADVRKLNNFRIPEEEGFQIPSRTKLKITNMIMQLISCGSMQEKEHSIDLFSSKLSMLGELPRLRLAADKKCFSGSLAETTVVEGDIPTLKRSSSCNADSDRNRQHNNDSDCLKDKEGVARSSKCIPLAIKDSFGKQLRCELLRSPLSESHVSKGSKRNTEPRSVIKIEESLLQELEL